MTADIPSSRQSVRPRSCSLSFDLCAAKIEEGPCGDGVTAAVVVNFRSSWPPVKEEFHTVDARGEKVDCLRTSLVSKCSCGSRVSLSLPRLWLTLRGLIAVITLKFWTPCLLKTEDSCHLSRCSSYGVSPTTASDNLFVTENETSSVRYVKARSKCNVINCITSLFMSGDQINVFTCESENEYHCRSLDLCDICDIEDWVRTWLGFYLGRSSSVRVIQVFSLFIYSLSLSMNAASLIILTLV